jgi:hypothetical protein
MSFLGLKNGVSVGVSPHVTLGGPNLLNKLSPSLLLQFAGATTLDPRITFTRASTATFTGSDGLIQSAAINTPRFDYDPVTLAPKGLLIEEQRTNLLTYSEQFDDAAWTKTRSSITANAILSPDGTQDADKLVEDSTASNTHQIQRSVSYTSGTTYTRTLYAKAGERTGFRFQFPSSAFTSGLNAYFDLSNGTVASVTSPATASITSVGNGWYRCTATATATATASGTEISCGLTISGTNPTYSGDGTSGLYIWGAQLEAGAFATSYIPTVASQVTRSSDSAVMTGTNFTSWYVQNDGTFFAEFIPSSSIVTPERGVISVDSTFARGHYFHLTTQLSTRTRDASGTYITTSVSFSPNQVQRMAGIWAQTIRNLCVNGGTVFANTTSATVPTNTQFVIGDQQIQGSSPRQLNGTIRRIAYYPTRLTNAQLQAITS